MTCVSNMSIMAWLKMPPQPTLNTTYTHTNHTLHKHVYTCTHMHTHSCTHTHAHTHMHTHMHTCTHMHTHTCTHTHAHTHMHTHMHTHTCTHMHTHTCTHMHTHTCTHTHAHTHMQMHTCTHTHTHAHTCHIEVSLSRKHLLHCNRIEGHTLVSPSILHRGIEDHQTTRSNHMGAIWGQGMAILGPTHHGGGLGHWGATQEYRIFAPLGNGVRGFQLKMRGNPCAVGGGVVEMMS